MKSNLFRTLKLAALAFCGAAAFACTNLDDIEQRLDSLESDIQKLQTAVSSLNEAVENLTTLAESGVISTIEKTEDGFVITTVTGEEITITNGAVGNTPLLSIEDGYWKVSYDNGESWEFMEDENGDKVPAAGMTPQFRVNEEGNWEVSYNGTQWTEVLDTEGNPVSAIGEGSNLFKDITYENGVLTIVFQDDNKLEIPVVPDFLCAIAGVDYATPVQFKHGEKKEFTVNIKGVANAIVTAPAGWKAELNGEEPSAILSVTAPEEDAASAMTKVSADTDSDVSILAVSTKGNYTAITKMQVMVVQEVVPVPAISSIALKEATQESLTFTVTPNSDVTSWKYILLKATETAPTDETAFAEADEKTGSTAQDVTIDGLAAGTSYKLYVLPVHTDTEAIYGDIKASEPASTEAPSYDTYFAMYEAGLNITIAGKEYNRETYGDAVQVTENMTISEITPNDKGVSIYFVNPDATVTYNYGTGVQKLIFIGNDPDSRSTLKVERQINLNDQTISGQGIFLCYNINLDGTGAKNGEGKSSYTVAQNGNNAFGYCGYVNCHIETVSGQPLSYISTSTRSFNEFVMEDCIYKFASAGKSSNKFVLSLGSSTATYNSLTFRNNVFYCTVSEQNFKLFNGSNANVGNLVLENNSFINLDTNTTYTVYANSIQNVSITKNLYSNNAATTGNGLIRSTVAVTGTVCTDNVAYGNETVRIFYTSGGVSCGFEGADDFILSETNPYDGGTLNFKDEIFVPNNTYSSYGYQQPAK